MRILRLALPFFIAVTACAPSTPRARKSTGCFLFTVSFDEGAQDSLVFDNLEEQFGGCIDESPTPTYACEAGVSSVNECEAQALPNVKQLVEEAKPSFHATYDCIDSCNE